MHRQGCARAVDRNGNHRRSRLDGQKERPRLEFTKPPVGRAPAFGKNKYGSAAANVAGGLEQAARGARGISFGHRHVTRPAQVPAQKRNMEQRPFGHDAEMRRQICEHHGNVEIALMIGCVNVGAAGIHMLPSPHADPHAADRQQAARPALRAGVLRAARRIRQRGEQRNRPPENREQINQRNGDEK